MGFPTDNYKGYVEADATHKAKNINSDTFFLVHGLADATAPYQHGVQLARSLVDAGTLFRYTVSRFQSLFLFNFEFHSQLPLVTFFTQFDIVKSLFSLISMAHA